MDCPVRARPNPPPHLAQSPLSHDDFIPDGESPQHGNIKRQVRTKGARNIVVSNCDFGAGKFGGTALDRMKEITDTDPRNIAIGIARAIGIRERKCQLPLSGSCGVGYAMQYRRLRHLIDFDIRPSGAVSPMSPT